MNSSDTIAAISSAVGPAARMIVRMSGAATHRIARSICDSLPATGEARRVVLHFDGMDVPAWVYLFGGPRSYTGEDLVEFHIPGNPLLARMLLATLVKFGARHAEAGEFTARAYFTGRLDLSEAEGVAATISAHSEHEARAARQLMAGELSRRLRPMMDLLADTLALVEAGIDFSDEDISFIAHEQVVARAKQIDADLDELTRGSARFERLTHEPTFVLVGRPNAGKSTLLNALAGRERAVVSPVAGTTRDVLSAEVMLGRGQVRLIDVAGLDESTPKGDDAPAEIERRMAEQARRAAETADFLIAVIECGDDRPAIELPRRADLVVRTKSDLHRNCEASDAIVVGAVSGAGVDQLRQRLDRLAFGESSAVSSTLALNSRHLVAIAQAREALRRVTPAVQSQPAAEVVALELRDALDALGQVLGQVTPDDVLGRIFSTFCIGK